MSPIIDLLKELIYQGLERFGRYYSTYRGFVVENKDPEGMQRLQVIVPGISDNPLETWAWGIGQFSGEGYGCQILPRKGDLIFVSFENGDPNFPLWQLGHFGEGEIPKEKQKVELYWFKTPKGFTIEIDDETEEMKLMDIFGNQIVSNKNGISLGLADKTKIFLGDIDKAKQPSVLGDNLEKVVAAQNKGILGAMKNISSIGKNFSSLASKLAAASTPIGLVTVLGTEVPGIVDSIKAGEEEMGESNKSLSALTKDIPGIKSSKVRINE